jgi:hypothetical protein
VVEVTGAAFDLPVVNAKHLNVNARNYTEQYHYTLVPLHFGDGAGLDQVMDDGLQKLKTRRLVPWKEAEAARQRLREVITRKGGAPLTEAEVAATNPVFEVPYANCSDPHKGKVLSCNWFDRGPDYYEMNRTKLENYWNYYFANHFRRDRSFFSTSSSINVAYSTFQEVSDVYKQWVLNLYRSSSPNQQGLNSYNFDVQFQDYWTMAVLDGINQNLNVMSVPPAGFFAYRNFSIPILDTQGNQATCATDTQCYSGVCSSGKCVWGPQWEVLSEGNDFDSLSSSGQDLFRRVYVDPRRVSPPAQGFGEMARGRGRRMYSRYDFKSGYGFYNRLLEAGHYNDQFGAMFAAIDSDSELYDVDYQSDANRYRIPYYLVFNKELKSYHDFVVQSVFKIQSTNSKKVVAVYGNQIAHWQWELPLRSAGDLAEEMEDKMHFKFTRSTKMKDIMFNFFQEQMMLKEIDYNLRMLTFPAYIFDESQIIVVGGFASSIVGFSN